MGTKLYEISPCTLAFLSYLEYTIQEVSCGHEPLDKVIDFSAVELLRSWGRGGRSKGELWRSITRILQPALWKHS